MLRHKMVIGACYAVQTRIQRSMAALGPKDTYISYLPEAHSFEQILFGMATVYGVRCGFYGGDVFQITADLAILKPTFFPSVPRLFNRIHGKISDGLNAFTGLKGWLAKKALNTKLANLKNGEGFTHKIYDKLVFSKVKARLGGNVRLMITGSAPIAGDVLDFLKVAFCCTVYEGYGMTETCAGSCVTFSNDPVTGHVGGPLQNVKIRLRDVPEMNYLHTNPEPKGEVQFWGPSIMKGYFKNP